MADKELSLLASLKDQVSSKLAPMAAQVRGYNAILEQHNKNMKPFGDLMSKARTAIMPLAAGFAVLAGAALGAGLAVQKLMAGFMERGAEIYNLAQKTGMSAVEISQLGYAARQSDVDLQTLGTGLKFLMKNMVAARGGNKELAAQFNALGVDINGTPKEALFKIADAISSIQDPAIRTALEMKLLGRAGQDLDPLLSGGSTALEKMADAADRMGITMSDSAAKGAADLDDQVNALRDSWQGLQNALAVDMLPAINDVIGGLQESVVWINENHNRLEDAVGMVLNFDTAIVALVPGLGPMIVALRNSSFSIGELASAILYSVPLIGQFAFAWDSLMPEHKIFSLTYITREVTEHYDVQGTWGGPTEHYGAGTVEHELGIETETDIKNYQNAPRVAPYKPPPTPQKKPNKSSGKGRGAGAAPKPKGDRMSLPEEFGYGALFASSGTSGGEEVGWDAYEREQERKAEQFYQEIGDKAGELSDFLYIEDLGRREKFSEDERAAADQYMQERLAWQDNEFENIQQHQARLAGCRDRGLISERQYTDALKGLAMERRKAYNSELDSATSIADSAGKLLGMADKDIAKAKIPLEIAKAAMDFADMATNWWNPPAAMAFGAAGLAHLAAAKELGEVGKGSSSGGGGGRGRSGGGNAAAPVRLPNNSAVVKIDLGRIARSGYVKDLPALMTEFAVEMVRAGRRNVKIKVQ